MRFRKLCALPLMFACVVAMAQSAPSVIAVKAGHLVDPASSSVADNQVILVRAGKIVQVGADVAIPAEATVIDLSQHWVLPGLVDAHTHITDNTVPTRRERRWKITR